MDPGLRALGELGQSQFPQIKILLWGQDSALQQLLPATTRHHRQQQQSSDEEHRGAESSSYRTFQAVVKSGLSSNRVEVTSTKTGEQTTMRLVFPLDTNEICIYLFLYLEAVALFLHFLSLNSTKTINQISLNADRRSFDCSRSRPLTHKRKNNILVIPTKVKPK